MGLVVTAAAAAAHAVEIGLCNAEETGASGVCPCSHCLNRYGADAGDRNMRVGVLWGMLRGVVVVECIMQHDARRVLVGIGDATRFILFVWPLQELCLDVLHPGVQNCFRITMFSTGCV